MSKYLINALGMALAAAGQSMIASAAAMPDVSDLQEVGDPTLTAHQIAAAVTPGQIAAAELDGEGLPWDERIHASTKTKTAVGLWTKKKAVDDTTRAAIVKQLREKYPNNPMLTQQTPLPNMAAPGVPGLALPAMPMTPYQELCSWLAANTGDGKVLTGEWVAEQFASRGTTLAEVANIDAAVQKQWLDAFKGVLAQMQA